MWPAGQSRSLSAKLRLREYDSCCLRGTGGLCEGGRASGGAHGINPFISDMYAKSLAQGLARRRKAPAAAQQTAKPTKRSRAAAAARRLLDGCWEEFQGGQ